MSTNTNHIKHVDKLAKSLIKQDILQPHELIQFNSLFKEATAAAANTDANFWITQEKRKKENQLKTSTSLDNVDKTSLAQLNQAGVVQNATNANVKNLNIVPLQIFLDNAINALQNVSKQEFKTNELINQFIEGKVSEDTVILETAKLNLAISMVTTIVQSAVQTFKEIQNIPV